MLFSRSGCTFNTFSRIQPAGATPTRPAKTSAEVLNPKHFIGVALILLITLSGFSALLSAGCGFLCSPFPGCGKACRNMTLPHAHGS
jgi:hypothetical protein